MWVRIPLRARDRLTNSGPEPQSGLGHGPAAACHLGGEQLVGHAAQELGEIVVAASGARVRGAARTAGASSGTASGDVSGSAPASRSMSSDASWRVNLPELCRCVRPSG